MFFIVLVLYLISPIATLAEGYDAKNVYSYNGIRKRFPIMPHGISNTFSNTYGESKNYGVPPTTEIKCSNHGVHGVPSVIRPSTVLQYGAYGVSSTSTPSGSSTLNNVQSEVYGLPPASGILSGSGSDYGPFYNTQISGTHDGSTQSFNAQSSTSELSVESGSLNNHHHHHHHTTIGSSSSGTAGGSSFTGQIGTNDVLSNINTQSGAGFTFNTQSGSHGNLGSGSFEGSSGTNKPTSNFNIQLGALETSSGSSGFNSQSGVFTSSGSAESDGISSLNFQSGVYKPPSNFNTQSAESGASISEAYGGSGFNFQLGSGSNEVLSNFSSQSGILTSSGSGATTGSSFNVQSGLSESSTHFSTQSSSGSTTQSGLTGNVGSGLFEGSSGINKPTSNTQYGALETSVSGSSGGSSFNFQSGSNEASSQFNTQSSAEFSFNTQSGTLGNAGSNLFGESSGINKPASNNVPLNFNSQSGTYVSSGSGATGSSSFNFQSGSNETSSQFNTQSGAEFTFNTQSGTLENAGSNSFGESSGINKPASNFNTGIGSMGSGIFEGSTINFQSGYQTPVSSESGVSSPSSTQTGNLGTGNSTFFLQFGTNETESFEEPTLVLQSGAIGTPSSSSSSSAQSTTSSGSLINHSDQSSTSYGQSGNLIGTFQILPWNGHSKLNHTSSCLVIQLFQQKPVAPYLPEVSVTSSPNKKPNLSYEYNVPTGPYPAKLETGSSSY